LKNSFVVYSGVFDLISHVLLCSKEGCIQPCSCSLYFAHQKIFRAVGKSENPEKGAKGARSDVVGIVCPSLLVEILRVNRSDKNF
jgi:hypothetical protein